MNKKITLIKSLTFLITFFCAANFGFGQIITFDFSGIIGKEASVVSNYNNGNLSSSTIIRGSGLTPTVHGDRFNAINWKGTNIADAISDNNFMQFTIAPNSGYQFDVSTIIVNFKRSDKGPTIIALRSSIDGYATTIDTEKTIAVPDITQIITFTLNQPNSATAITYRIYGWGTDNNHGSGGFEGDGDDIIVNGTVSAIPPCSATATTWNGTNWDNGLPDIFTPAVIDDYFDTGNGGSEVSFSACSLIVTNNGNLNIADNTYVEVKNDITVNTGGTINVQPYGAVVQIDDLATTTNDGTISVAKMTSLMSNWYEYTYWSSPVKGELISTGLAESEVDRRYEFNAQNYLDATVETGNNDATVAGQDGIDDNGDDWQWISGTTSMEPGVGYASMNDQIIFGSTFPYGNTPKQIEYTFEGPFNNGVIPVPIYRNDSELNDDNLNLIGNPYPSAIDAQSFLDANTNIAQDVVGTSYDGIGYIDGAIYLWSQNTAPSATANGNQQLNFSDSDYAIINGTGQNAGGDGVMPERYIPSGQGFFISLSNSGGTNIGGDIWTADVIFNNSMRVKGATDNSQFFKNSNTKSKSSASNINKLWVNLTSDNGVFNQTLIGYVKGATNNYDGAYYDAEKNSSSKAAILYSTIDGLNKAFAIQGKAENSLNTDEIINLGFSTQIDVPTLYTLSIAKKEGDFLTGSTIYVLDNVTHTLHDLSTSDYTFTSAVGEFNDRFKIVFDAKALSTETFNMNDNTVKISQVDDAHVSFKASNTLSIKTVTVFDLLGRQLYQFKGHYNEETYTFSHLNNSVFIAKIKLSNGAIITKKAVLK